MKRIASPRVPLALLIVFTAAPLLASNTVIRFDLPPTVAAKPGPPGGHSGNIVHCQFRLSSLIASPDSPQIDQWLIVCGPRDPSLVIVDYRPKTNAQSEIEGPIEVKSTNESTSAMGVSLDGHYGTFVGGNLGADQGKKKTDSRQYSLAAPQRAVTASGTINRGRGVYFKLRRSARQVLEGEKTFQLSFRVPPSWRGSLIDVSIIAQSQRRSFAGLDKQIKTMGQSNFVVAAYRDGDQQAAQLSHQLAVAEQSLRNLAHQQATNDSVSSLSAMLRRVAIKLDLQSPDRDDRWVWRLLAGEADPYLDKQIRRLPMEIRLAVLDYCELRDAFERLADVPAGERADRVAANTRSQEDNAH